MNTSQKLKVKGDFCFVVYSGCTFAVCKNIPYWVIENFEDIESIAKFLDEMEFCSEDFISSDELNSNYSEELRNSIFKKFNREIEKNEYCFVVEKSADCLTVIAMDYEDFINEITDLYLTCDSLATASEMKIDSKLPKFTSSNILDDFLKF